MVAIVAIAMGCVLAMRRIDVDIFPRLNLPVIYVCQPYGGMDPAQMEGLLTNYYEYHFLYISGIHHVESRNVQGVALMKLYFHPGTDMAQAMAETISYVNRARAFMPPGTVSPFVMRFDTGSVPVGCLVLSSETRSLTEIQDLALFRVRPMFASLPGVSAPPPFGGSARTVVVRLDPDRLRAYRVAPEDVIMALTQGNAISPSGNMHIGDRYPIVPVNAMVKQVDELRNIPLWPGASPAVYLRDVGEVEDTTDIPVGYALVNGRRAIYMLVTKRAEASTLSVVNEVKAALPRMQKELPDDIKVTFELDQSPVVTRSIQGLATEALLGAVLTGLMVLLFLRDWRSALVVVFNIPLALASAVIALWLSDQTINLMTLGGLALAVGILVDEATVEIENIHTQMAHSGSIARAVRLGNAQTSLPRLLAMLCILAVFIPSFFMQGSARALFVPMSLAVGFSMMASYLLSSTFVPVVSTWLLRRVGHDDPAYHEAGWFAHLRMRFLAGLERVVRWRVAAVVGYVGVSAVAIVFVGGRLGREIFPRFEADKFRLRLRAPDGTHFERTEQIALDVLDRVKQRIGKDKIDITLGYVGTIPSSYPVNAVYQWSRGPEEAILWVSLKHGSGVNIERLKEDLRTELAETMPEVRCSFEPADIVNEVMSFGSPTPIDISVSGTNFSENRAYAEKLQRQLAKIDALRDLQFAQSLDYPTVEVKVDREKAGLSGVTPAEVARSLVAATSSSRFVVPNYWPDPKTGIGYQVQVEVPQAAMHSVGDLGTVPIKHLAHGQLLLRDVATVSSGTMPGQYDRYNMKRQVSLTANIAGADLGSVATEVQRAIAAAGEPPKGSTVEVRGQIPPLQDMLRGLGMGLMLAVVVIFLLLAANFQSWKLALVTVSTAPAAIVGVVLMLWITRTTLNIQSFMGAIMAIGVAMANGILLVTFAEEQRRRAAHASDAESASRVGRSTIAVNSAVEAASRRLRPILMTSAAMIAGMLPMALALGEGGQQSAPLGRAVVGGLLLATLATLFVLPCIFSLVQARSRSDSASLDPDDPDSPNYDRAVGEAGA
jgi:multidrug efflux pump subunit AcrB